MTSTKRGELMAKYQDIFKRYEVKYLLTEAQAETIKNAFGDTMKPDKYGESRISNIYFDTPSHLLIRRSLEKPVYKEKLRLRSYGCLSSEDTAFVELKKKYNGVVYKRRIAMTQKQAVDYLCRGAEPPEHTQITAELDYFMKFYGEIMPTAYISYERTAFYSTENDGLRITFDRNILWRDTDLSLLSGAYGSPLLNENEVLMEIKVPGAMPLRLTHLLDENKLSKTSFSKYGNAYIEMQSRNKKRGVHCA